MQNLRSLEQYDIHGNTQCGEEGAGQAKGELGWELETMPSHAGECFGLDTDCKSVVLSLGCILGLPGPVLVCSMACF